MHSNTFVYENTHQTDEDRNTVAFTSKNVSRANQTDLIIFFLSSCALLFSFDNCSLCSSSNRLKNTELSSWYTSHQHPPVPPHPPECSKPRPFTNTVRIFCNSLSDIVGQTDSSTSCRCHLRLIGFCVLNVGWLLVSMLSFCFTYFPCCHAFAK